MNSFRLFISIKIQSELLNKQTGECRLVISMTFADDAGEYTIVIRNKHGETSASASLEEGECNSK